MLIKCDRQLILQQDSLPLAICRRPEFKLGLHNRRHNYVTFSILNITLHNMYTNIQCQNINVGAIQQEGTTFIDL